MQGFNMGRYYPPDEQNPPAFNTTSHPLGARARKSGQGILTVRFELPFAVWCTHCVPEMIVGQGVRFNAEKKKVGNYYSTPVWSFRMKHGACGGWWEIRTDPKVSEYVVVEGCRRREYGSNKEGVEGEMRMLSEEERERRREDAFAGLEGKLEEKEMERVNRDRIEELLEASEVWEDPYTMNQKLRKEFRGRRKAFERDGRYKEELQEKYGFGLEIVDEVESDKMRAGLVEFGVGQEVDVAKKPLFVKEQTKAVESGSKVKKLKKDIVAETSRKNLKETLVGNTRVGIDPFLADTLRSTAKANTSILPGLKRKRNREISTTNDASSSPKLGTTPTNPSQTKLLPTTLVGYDSD
ncbi:CWC16 protein [Lophiotrema nucula]|uniref:CWC16 protein n=1 Tax=Lophiotrema nucula TaxID=690887 RepID=A0A6A5ZUC8_9PLEO|nr:CWC16 protein [Lophiotrema nucula]